LEQKDRRVVIFGTERQKRVIRVPQKNELPRTSLQVCKSRSTECEQGEGGSTHCLWADKSSPTEMFVCYNVTRLKFEQADCKYNRPYVQCGAGKNSKAPALII